MAKGTAKSRLGHQKPAGKGNVKSRLGLNNQNMAGIKKAKQTGNAIIKKIGNAGPGTKKELKLFTKHFDARSKIQPKKLTPKKQQAKTAKNKRIDTGNGIAKKALEGIALNSKKTRREDMKRKNNATKTTHRVDRESTFTGKSIQVIAKNDKAPKIREAKVKGKMLSVTATNSRIKKNRKNPPRMSPNKPLKVIKRTQLSSFSPQLHEEEFGIDDDNIEEEYITESSKAQLPAKMIISNLHPNVTQDDIKELFGAVGNLLEARLNSLGTAEVVYSNAEDAFAAYNKYNTRNLDGQPMILKITTVEEQQGMRSSLPTRSSSSSLSAYKQQQQLQQQQQQQQYSRVTATSTTRARNNYGGSVTKNQTSPTKPVVFTVRL